MPLPSAVLHLINGKAFATVDSCVAFPSLRPPPELTVHIRTNNCGGGRAPRGSAGVAMAGGGAAGGGCGCAGPAAGHAMGTSSNPDEALRRSTVSAELAPAQGTPFMRMTHSCENGELPRQLRTHAWHTARRAPWRLPRRACAQV